MFSAERALRIATHAKINLSLEVLRKRADGFHDLRSVMVPVSLADEISLAVAGTDLTVLVEAEPGFDLSRLGPSEENLAYRAARLLQARHGAPAGIQIHIHKKIPIGGGLGGGSADGAAVLWGLNRLCALGLSAATLQALGAELGSDLPAMLHGGAVCMEGRGERVQTILAGVPRPVPGFWLVLANPGICVPTKHAYQLCSCIGGLTESPNSFNNIVSSVRNGNVLGAAAALFNGLEPGVFATYLETARLAERLRDAGGLGVLMSGSGASVFALVRDEAHGEDVRRKLGAGVWSMLIRTLPDGVMVAHGPLEPRAMVRIHVGQPLDGQHGTQERFCGGL